jgi:Flp pilus assembly protein TadD
MQKPVLQDDTLAQALALHRAGKLGQAIRLYEKVVRKAPRHAGAHKLLGVACHQAGRLDEAAAALETSLKLDPSQKDAHYNLGIVLHGLGRYEEAAQQHDQALAANPNDFEAHNSLGAALKELGRCEEAIKHYQRAIALRPDYAEAHCNIAGALIAMERFDEAVAHSRRALELNSGLSEAQFFLGASLNALDRNEEAEQQLVRYLALKPARAVEYMMRGMALANLKRQSEAVPEFDRAIELDPKLADAYVQRGFALTVLGRLDDARRDHEHAIALAPQKIEAHQALTNLTPIAAGDPRLGILETLAQGMDKLAEPDRGALHAALAKAYADLKEHERSFRHAVEAGRLKRKRMPYDESEAFAHMRLIAEVFSADLLRATSGGGESSELPIFIVGMPRSGTTLIEQILASHPEVFGAGELQTFGRLARRVRDGAGPPRYPEAVPSLSAQALREIGANYVRDVQRLAPQASRITDKMPGNFHYVGLIHLALPNAKIIHSRRNPLDNCMSCFSTQFAKGHPWSYELGELGRYHRAYQQLMEHWRRVLPVGAMLEVDYESVVTDLEEEARRIVEYCGLQWDDACLAFDKTERPVHTASVAQVRQPIYRSSVGRWEPYKDQLRPLFEALQIG